MHNNNMDETYNCGDTVQGLSNNDGNESVNMSKTYSISSLDSRKIRDYLKSFSNKSVKIKDSLGCLYNLKQKSEKKCKLYRQAKPYSRNMYESGLSVETKCSQSQFSILEHKIKAEMKNTANSKYLKIKNSNGTTTEVTLKPIVLMHVREIPADSLANKEERQNKAFTSPSQPLCQLNVDSPEAQEVSSRSDHENNLNTNVLRVKSSHNSTDLSSERKLSGMKMSSNIFLTPENFRRSNSLLRYNSMTCNESKMSLINLPTCPNICYHDPNLISNYNRCLENLIGKLQENKDIIGVSSSEYVRYDNPQVNYSVTTFFRHPAPRPSSTSSGYIHSPRPSDKEIN